MLDILRRAKSSDLRWVEHIGEFFAFEFTASAEDFIKSGATIHLEKCEVDGCGLGFGARGFDDTIEEGAVYVEGDLYTYKVWL